MLCFFSKGEGRGNLVLNTDNLTFANTSIRYIVNTNKRNP